MNYHIGHNEIFEEVFKRYYLKLYAYALTFVRNENDAIDIVSNVFEYLWANSNMLEKNPSNIQSILYILIRNRSIDYLRKKEVELKYFQYQSYINTEHYLSDENDSDKIEKLMHVIDRLPNQTKNVVISCFIDGNTYRETAENLGISINTVKTHLSKAMRIFRQELSENE